MAIGPLPHQVGEIDIRRARQSGEHPPQDGKIIAIGGAAKRGQSLSQGWPRGEEAREGSKETQEVGHQAEEIQRQGAVSEETGVKRARLGVEEVGVFLRGFPHQ